MAKRMSQKKQTNDRAPAIHPSHIHGEESGALAGELVGAVVGAAAGLPGAVAGMVIGGAAGALAGKVLDTEAERAHIRDEELDKEIGVSDGNLGVADALARKALESKAQDTDEIEKFDKEFGGAESDLVVKPA